MSASGFELSDLYDARLAPLVTSQLPAWLWRADATRIIWANPVGAAIFAASTSAAIAAREFDAAHPAAAQIARLATSLPPEAPPRLERLRGFGGELGRALACACSQVILRDGTAAVLVVAAEGAGPQLSLSERVHRLLAGSPEPVAVYSAAGQLLCATQSAHAHLRGATSLAALGAQALAATALASGHASGNVGDRRLSLDRLGSDTATVLVVDFAAHEKIAAACEALPLQGPPPQPAAAASAAAMRPAAATAGEASFASSPCEFPAPPQWSAPDERRHPLRFVWQLDEQGVFTLGSDEFVELVGAPTAATVGRPWADMAAELALDPDGSIARAIATHDTFSGLTVSWPVEGGKDRLPVELSGLPVFDRERIFRGYRGFGVCRDVARLTVLTVARQARATSSGPPAARVAAAAPGQSPLAARDVPGENIVAFASGTADVIAPALTPLEHMAFHELSRKLAQGLAGAGAEFDVRSAASAPMRKDQMALAETRALESASDARPLLDRMPAGILIYRLNHLLYANPTFLRWSGHRTLDGLVEAGGLDELFIEPLAAAAAGDDQSVTLRLERGDKVALKGEVMRIDWEGEPAHALLTALKQGDAGKPAPLQSEISELAAMLDARSAQWKETERELIEARQRAEAASSAKSDFLAKISHEIRTPLNSIIGFSEVMLAEQFGAIGNERYREYLKDIHASGGHLLSLINDLLDLSKIEAGKLQLTFAGLALNDLTAQCVATMQPQANRGRIIIRTALAPALPQVLADARSVRQIVLNLLSNSLKFTPAGGQVIVSTALNGDGDVILRVRDTGVGMTEKDIVTALEPFRQLATSPRGGTGLGLPLTKAMAEANRAKFHLTSTPKEGTLVEIAFPASSTLAG
jgi:signal transduction histidine kinase/PAS domain-containing protein